MNLVLNIAQIVISILLIIAVLLQHSGTGLGGAFGAEGNAYRSKRGIEKTLMTATVVLAILFVIATVLNIIIK